MSNRDDDIKQFEDLTNLENESEVEKEKEFHLDPTSGEDRRKILASYKKSLRKRAFAPLIGGNVGINPIDLLKEEEENKEKNNDTIDIYDIVDRRLSMMEKKVNQALSMARFGACASVICLLLLILLFSLK